MIDVEREDLLERIESEGFAYAFLYYSNFKEIEDIEFHILRVQFESSARALANYIGCDV